MPKCPAPNARILVAHATPHVRELLQECALRSISSTFRVAVHAASTSMVSIIPSWACLEHPPKLPGLPVWFACFSDIATACPLSGEKWLYRPCIYGCAHFGTYQTH